MSKAMLIMDMPIQKAVGFGTDNEYIMGRKDGWNRCIDEILGGGE